MTGADLVIEAVPERMELKRAVFAELDAACRPDEILATNTSSLSVTALAAGTPRPARVADLHFFNPAPVMKLVEVISTVLTAPGTGEALGRLARALGKTPVQVGDRAGFIGSAAEAAKSDHPVPSAWRPPVACCDTAAATRAWLISGLFVGCCLLTGHGRSSRGGSTSGRSMIIMGAGTNHFFHSDTIYRAFLALVTMTGCQGRNGGGWAHYVGQEKVRPVTGHATLAMATDWQRPARQMIGTAYWYLATDQWRCDTSAPGFDPREAAPLT